MGRGCCCLYWCTPLISQPGMAARALQPPIAIPMAENFLHERCFEVGSSYKIRGADNEATYAQRAVHCTMRPYTCWT
ncbi:hypothetical protein HaLaN_30646 [Haematococcus lacustris]|uniref:Uncharacterized protein n=1 Tax=Haematococcus lacustris TaxID=44745 RepID=A0A6A0AG01_HAELA|nr:hypothetical protein HaLaN_30646 [Haematococcus lacustris]